MSDATRRLLLGGAIGALVASGLARAQALAPPPLPPLSPPPVPGQGAWPPELQPGMRLTWFGGAAFHLNDSTYLVPDDHGEWHDRAGHRFREVDTDDTGGTSFGGAGYTAMDILAAGSDGFVVHVTPFAMHLEAGRTTTFEHTTGLICGAEGLGDYWTARAKLAALADLSTANLRVMHQPYILDKRSYNAVRIQAQASGGWTQTTFDLETGIGLVSTSTVTQQSLIVDPFSDMPVQGAGNAVLTFSHFKGARPTNLPGPGATYPDAVRRLRSVVYTGSKGTRLDFETVHIDPIPFEFRRDILSGAARYLKVRNFITGRPPIDQILPAGVLGSLWMDPRAIGPLRPGQRLDADPIVGATITARGQDGSLALIETNTLLTQSLCGYDLTSGLLTTYEHRLRMAPATITTAMRLASAS